MLERHQRCRTIAHQDPCQFGNIGSWSVLAIVCSISAPL